MYCQTGMFEVWIQILLNIIVGRQFQGCGDLHEKASGTIFIQRIKVLPGLLLQIQIRIRTSI